MAERGIIFSAPMVRALLDGEKTQTRRLLKLQPADTIAAGKQVDHVGDYCTGAPQHGQAYYWRANGCWNSSEPFRLPCAKGDRLYVRETWSVRGIYSDVVEVGYRASELRGHTEYVEQWPVNQAVPGKGEWPEWPKSGPAIHMPRWASRLWLTVTDVRTQRLKDISGFDAVAEGVKSRLPENGIAQQEFADLWNTLHAGSGEQWHDNPWIVAISFDVHRGNIDRCER